MYCKLCNTRVGEGERVCPNCGKTLAADPLHRRAAPEPQPAPRAGEADLGEPDELEVSLEEALQEVRAEPAPEPAPPPRAASAPARERPPREAPPPSEEPRGEADAAALLGLEPEVLRELVAGDPGILEPGLRPLEGGGGGSGAPGHATPVGAIDLLARDAHGALVVVQVAERGSGSAALSEALERVGWVRKHLAQPGQRVRALVLAESPPAEVGYAAAAVAETVAFKTWRVRLEVEDVPL